MSFLAFALPVFSTHVTGDGSGRTDVCTHDAWVKATTYLHMYNMKKIASRGMPVFKRKEKNMELCLSNVKQGRKISSSGGSEL